MYFPLVGRYWYLRPPEAGGEVDDVAVTTRGEGLIQPVLADVVGVHRAVPAVVSHQQQAVRVPAHVAQRPAEMKGMDEHVLRNLRYRYVQQH